MRILGNNISNKKKIYIALTCIYGIGIPTSKNLLNKLNIDLNLKLPELTERNLSDLRDIVENENLKLEGDLIIVGKVGFFKREVISFIVF